MKINYLEKDKSLLVELTEEIDHCKTEELRRKIDYEIERHMPKKVIFDFNSVNFMDSSGIGFLLGRFKLATMLGGDLGLINVSKSTKKILEMSGALKVIPIYDNFKFAI